MAFAHEFESLSCFGSRGFGMLGHRQHGGDYPSNVGLIVQIEQPVAQADVLFIDPMLVHQFARLGERGSRLVLVRTTSQGKALLDLVENRLVHVSRLTALGEMASALAHELNQPLSAIANYLKGSSRLLASGAPPLPRIREAIDKAADQALRAGEIIRRLRDFVSRGETERRIESLSKLVEEAGALALVGVKNAGIRVRFEYDPAADLVLADRVQIQQVVLNLIRNAIDAMQDRSRRELVVSTSRVDPAIVLVSVADTGPGIAPEIAEQMFQPFVTTKRHGMGVGLSISRTIVEGHGGTIWIEPTPGGGTTFRFTLSSADEENKDVG